MGETAADYLNVNLGFGLGGTSWAAAAVLAVVLVCATNMGTSPSRANATVTV